MNTELRIEDFLPKYPNINNTSEAPFMNPYPDFYNSLYSKYELYSLKLDREEQRPPRGEQYKHQKIIARFLSAHTLYNKLLLVHEMGTGKSCSIFGAIEEIRNQTSTFKGALILSRGPRIIANLINELAYVCTVDKYVPDELSHRLTEKERARRIKKLVSTFYAFNTFDKFTKDLQRMSNADIVAEYSNKIIGVDEVHNLRIHGKAEESRMYNQIHRLLHVARNTKIILMSGTPMKDDASEIAAILNLILPLDRQLPTRRDFTERYLTQHGSGIYKYNTVRQDRIGDLKQHFKGIVSYLKAMTSDVEVQYVGKSIGSLKHFKVVASKMGDFQSNAYRIAYSQDVSKGDGKTESARYNTDAASGVYSNSRQASLFVFPDSGYGKKGFDTAFKRQLVYRTTRYIPNPSFTHLQGNTVEETIERVSKCSAVYASILQSIVKNPDKLHFIYNSFVHGSGAIVLGKLLELIGFRPASGGDGTSAPRYAVLTNSTLSQSHVERIIKRFNAQDNMNGKFIRVIIGSRILAEGITLRNVQEIHIATPHWNYSELAQAIARGVRLEVHRDLIQDGQHPTIRIYQHVALPEGKTPSIDLEMYELCEAKDISIKNIEHLIRESAVDCALFYERNAPGPHAVDGSRECDYQKCDYKCDGITTMNPPTLDYSTYNLYYKQSSHIEEDIIRMFRTSSVYTLDEIIQKLDKNYDVYDILYSLRKLISDNIPIKSKLDFDVYLREQNNVYFLNDRMIAGNDFFSSTYADNPIIKYNMNFGDATDSVYLDAIKMGQNVKQVGYAFDRLSFNAKRVFIETLLEKSKDRITPVMQLVITHIQPMIKRSGTAYELDETLFCLQDGEWVVCEDDKMAEPEISDELASGLVQEDNDPEFEEKMDKFGYTGEYSAISKKFCIKQQADPTKVKKDVRTKRTGKVCKTWTKVDLLEIIHRLAIPYESLPYIQTKDRESLINEIRSRVTPGEKNMLRNLDEFSDDDLRRVRYYAESNNDKICNTIQEFMTDNSILYRSDDCGVMGRKKKE